MVPLRVEGLRWQQRVNRSKVLQKLRDQPGRASRTIGLHGAIAHLATDVLSDGVGDDVWRGGREIHASSGAIAAKTVRDMVVLLEVMAQREVQERPLIRCQLHRGGEAALNDCEITSREVAIK